MTAFITALHILACLALVAVVLLQHGKGADMGAAFGGGASNTVFGARGAGNFLTKLTTGAVVVFMLTSITLSYFSRPSTVSELISNTPAAESAVEPQESTFPKAEPIEEGELSGTPSGFEAIPPPESGQEQ